ncbi:universal stress protein [Streptomyces sp. NPDC051172]|uniref:universal stress protein n=1 Tax=Streptomyces sp. NPDC051172 TaxID=3155796 RepID=UPI00341900B2
MSSTLPVIAAVDGSDDSLRALDWALDDARRRAVPLRVVHVRQYAAWAQPDILAVGPPEPGDDPVLGQVRTYLKGRTDLPAVEYHGLEGVPGALLPELGAGAQLLVLGSRGRGGFAGLLLGSNSMAAARDAECPVVVVPRPGRDGGTTHAFQAVGEHGDVPVEPGPRVVVGLQVDSPDEATLAFAFTEAGLRGARLHVVAAYMWPVQTWTTPGELAPPVIDQHAVENQTWTLAEGFLAPHRSRHPDVPVDTYAMPGDAAGRLVAASKDAGLVVVGRHRRRLLAPARMMGSVAQAVLLHAAAPVAVVPPVIGEE